MQPIRATIKFLDHWCEYQVQLPGGHTAVIYLPYYTDEPQDPEATSDEAVQLTHGRA